MVEIFLTAIALSMDSFALSMVAGSINKNISIKQIVKIALVFGVFQAIMPYFGYIFGAFMVDFIFNLHRIIASVLLLIVGIKFIVESFQIENKSIELGFVSLIVGGFITSIDAFAVGIAYGFEKIHILHACTTIGLICAIFCVVGVFLGNKIGRFLEDKALKLGGFILIGIALSIFF